MHAENITKYELEVYRKPVQFSFQEDKFEITKQTIIAQNDKYIVLDTPFYCKLGKPSRDTSRIYDVLNKPRIYFKSCLDAEGIFYTLYTTKTKRISTIRREIEREAERKYGWLFTQELDLSILERGGK